MLDGRYFFFWRLTDIKKRVKRKTNFLARVKKKKKT